MLSGPMRITPEEKFVLARSIENPESLKPTNGEVVPADVPHITCKLAGTGSWVSRTGNCAGASIGAWTDASPLTAKAVKSGGADPKAVAAPSIQIGSPGTVPAGKVRVPVLTTKLDELGVVEPLPAKIKP
jgi:hypothetical protein